MAYSGVDEVAIKKQVVLLTDAQTKALPTTPIEIVPAVAGKMSVPLGVVYVADNMGGVYTNIGASCQLVLQYSVGSVAALVANNSPDPFVEGLLGEADIVVYPIMQDGRTYTFPQNEGALQLKLAANAGDLTGGDPANTLEVTVLYLVKNV